MSDSPRHKNTLHAGLGATLPQRELCLANYISIPYMGGLGGGEGGASQPVTPGLPVLPLVSRSPRVLPTFYHLHVFLIITIYFTDFSAPTGL